MDLNIVCLMGKLTENAEVSTTKNGNSVVNFTIETAKKSGDADRVSLQYYGKDAEQIFPYMTKGRKVAVMGRVKTESWSYNGKPYSKLVVACNELEVLGFGKDDRGEPTEGPYAQPNDGLVGPEAFDDSDIPF